MRGNTGEVSLGFALPDNFTRIAVTGNLIQPDDADGQRLLIFPEELDAAFAPDFNRTSLFTFGEYDTGLYGNMTAYFEASYATRETKTNTAGQGAINLAGDLSSQSISILLDFLNAFLPVTLHQRHKRCADALHIWFKRRSSFS